jgi:hypothetical protein
MTVSKKHILKNKAIEKIFKSKRSFHKEMAELPIEEKIKNLIELQRINIEILKSRGVKLKPHQKVWTI